MINTLRATVGSHRVPFGWTGLSGVRGPERRD
jgi:hypothetical protein